MQAVLSMLVAVFLWSLYPPLVAMGNDYINLIMFVLFIHMASGISALLFSYLKLRWRPGYSDIKQRMKKAVKNITLDQFLYLMIVGLVSTLYNFCFIYAMKTTSKVGASIIIETWPIIAMFLAPMLISKAWDKLRFHDFVAALIALIGVAILMIEDQKNLQMMFFDFSNYMGTADFMSLVGIMAAFIGSLCLAASIILRAEISNRISKDILGTEKQGVTCAFMAEFVCRMVALPSTFFLMWVFADDLSIQIEGIVIASFIGVFIFNIGAVAITVALLKATSSSISMLYYLTPVFAVIWLYLLGMAEITPLVIVGGVIVILANLLVLKRPKDRAVESA